MRSLSILVAEDEPLLALAMDDILKEMGHEVCAIEATESGTVAAALLHRPDIMIVDAGLSRGSGVSAVAEILHTLFIPHVFASGDQLWDQFLHPRAIVLQKPYQEADLAGAIERAMGAPGT